MSNHAPELYTVEEGWFETYSGHKFYFRDPFDCIDVLDIAHSVSLLCRYNGHSKRFYAVAEHTILLALWALRNRHTYELAYDLLHHDDAEYVIGDMMRPVKVTMTEFKVVEAELDRVFAARLGFRYPFRPMVKELDSRILRDERDQVMSNSNNEWGTDRLKPLGIRVRFWSPRRAEAEFLFLHNWLLQRMGRGEERVPLTRLQRLMTVPARLRMTWLVQVRWGLSP